MKLMTTENRRWLPLLPLLALLFGIGPVHAESTLTLRKEMSPSGRFAVENLAGTMRISQGSGSSVVVVATVHGEDEKVAGMLKIEQVSGDNGVPTLRLVYPIDEYGTFRYKERGAWFGNMFGGSNTTTKYAGQRVKVSTSSGTLLYADVDIQFPRGGDGMFLNTVGNIDAGSVEGTLSFDSGSGNVTLKAISGSVKADTGSGDIDATSLEGSFKGNTGSGNITIAQFQGDSIKCSTGSGNIKLEGFTSTEVKADTGSGNIKLVNGRMDEFKGGTGSGNIDVETQGGSLKDLDAGTGSGNVTLRLGQDASFDAKTETGSGDIVSRYDDAQPVISHKEVIGYKRGSLATRIKVSTGSGNVILEPGS